MPAALTAVLDAIEAEADDRPQGRDALAAVLAEASESADPNAAGDVQRWALRRDDAAEVWPGRPLRRAFANPLNLDVWREILARTPPELRPALTRVVLRVAEDRTLPDEPFRWGVEEILLPTAETERPHDPAWPGRYLDRMPSGLELLKRLFRKGVSLARRTPLARPGAGPGRAVSGTGGAARRLRAIRAGVALG